MGSNVPRKQKIWNVRSGRLEKATKKLLLIHHYALKGHIFRTLIIRNYFKKNTKTKLQVGCGYNNLTGWLNADVFSGDIFLNAKRKLPFKTNSFDFIYCEHFIEHLSKEDAFSFLKNCFEILKINGIIRVASPDLEKIIDLYYDKNQYVKRQVLIEAYGEDIEFQPCELFNDYMHKWGHTFIYDKKMIVSTLTDAGFTEVNFCPYKESDYLELTGLEKHLEQYDFLNLAESFIVEGKKK